MMSSYNHLCALLQCAVPLRIAELRARGGPTELDFDTAQDSVLMLVEEGDALMARTKRTALVTGKLIHMVAVLAFLPGGIECFGARWEA